MVVKKSLRDQIRQEREKTNTSTTNRKKIHLTEFWKFVSYNPSTHKVVNKKIR